MNDGKFYNKIILASASPRRRELLERANIDFDVQVSDADEINSSALPPCEIAKYNAEQKALAVSKLNDNRIVLGADTIVVLEGKVYGKPTDLNDARKMLNELAGKSHSVFTAIAFAKNNQILKSEIEESIVKFRDLNSSQIEDYLQKVYVLDKAGAYAAQEFGSLIIENIAGNFDNVMGLPCSLVKCCIEQIEE